MFISIIGPYGWVVTVPLVVVLGDIERWVPRTAHRCVVELVVDSDRVAQDLDSFPAPADSPADRMNRVAQVVVAAGRVDKIAQVVVAAGKVDRVVAVSAVP